jgi:hypothetical protein
MLVESEVANGVETRRKEAGNMQQQCRWLSHLEDVHAYPLDRVLWYKQGCEQWPVIFPAGYRPSSPFLRIGTIGELLAAMEQALIQESSLRQSMNRHAGIIIQAHINEQGTTYRFYPVPESCFLSV